MTALRAPLKALAALLLYPEEGLRAAMPEVAAILRAPGLPPEAGAAAEFAEPLAAAAPLEAEGAYVGLFDGAPSLSLYLFQHVHGDDRDRGAAMAALIDDYRAAGLELAGEELPDFLPVFLEYAATRPDEAEARALLGEISDIVALLALRLEGRGAAGYAAVMRALGALAARPADAEAVAARVAEDVPDHTPEALDAAYEEAPVSFMEPVAPNEPCPKAAEIVARFEAAAADAAAGTDKPRRA